MANSIKNKSFISDIIDGMYDWVRVIDRDYNILYVNKAMSDAIGKPIDGLKCYIALGKTQACETCISRNAIFDGASHEKEEIIQNRTYSVMSSPLRNAQGEIIAAVEVLRDVTETKKLQKKVMEQNRKMKSDLNVAKKLQCSLLPKPLHVQGISFSYVYKPSEDIGGDFVDIFTIDSDHVGVYIADVSGHGVSASILTVFLRGAINKKLSSPAAVLSELFHSYKTSNINGDLYITVFYAVVNIKTKTVTFSNAGHNMCPIIFNQGKFEILRAPGIPISNWLEDPGYINKSVKLSEGDRLFFYTDGIVETKNSENEQYGEKRLLDILLLDESEPDVVLNKIIEDAWSFAQIKEEGEIPDDITMALMEIK